MLKKSDLGVGIYLLCAVIFFIVIVVISVAQMTITGKKEEQL